MLVVNFADLAPAYNPIAIIGVKFQGGAPAAHTLRAPPRRQRSFDSVPIVSFYFPRGWYRSRLTTSTPISFK